jgi:hypothetical protein
VLHEAKKLLLNYLQLLLNDLLLLLELILTCLHLRNSRCCLLCLTSLVLPHELKYAKLGLSAAAMVELNRLVVLI